MTADTYQRQLGERLRAIRAQQNLTLQDVETRSDGRWKAVVVGSYERGDRAISISKLAELGRFYGVPLSDLLPTPRSEDDARSVDDGPRLVLDLTRFDDEAATDPRLSAIRRLARRIQTQRGDYNGRVLTLRGDDLEALAAVFDTGTTELVRTLESKELLLSR